MHKARGSGCALMNALQYCDIPTCLLSAVMHLHTQMLHKDDLWEYYEYMG